MKVGIIGGHLTPALAVIEHLPSEVEVVYFGRKYAMEGDSAVSLEYQTIRSRGIHFVEFSTGRLQRTFTSHTFASLRKIPQGFRYATYLLKLEQVDVIVGFGGYLSVPLCFAAKILKIPIIIHEQTLRSGLANKIIAPFADTICVSWEESRRYFSKRKRVLVTGNPLVTSSPTMPSFLAAYTHHRPLLVIVGGSQGAHVINRLVEESLETLLATVDIIHQTGDAKQFGDFDRLIAVRSSFTEEKQKRYILEKFIDPSEIDSVYRVADMVVGRAGINTVTTLLLLNKPALLIPIIVGQKHEQMTNALMFVKTGLGEVLEQRDLTSEVFQKRIHQMMSRISTYSNSELIVMKSLHEHAAKLVAEVIIKACKKQPNA